MAAETARKPAHLWWDGIAEKYFHRPVGNPDGYAATLDRIRSYLGRDHDVLEIGCGTGTTAIKLAPGFRSMTATDFSPGMIGLAERRVAEAGGSSARFLIAPADAGPFAAASFDGVIASSVLHLLPDVDKTLDRVHQLLRPGGLFISKTTCMGDHALGGLHWRIMIRLMQMVGKAPFVRFLREEDLARRIETAGFEIIERRSFDGSPHVPFIVARKL